MNQKTVILKFPEPKDFFDWLRKRGIHQYGNVVIENRRSGSHGVPLVSYSVRMSAHDTYADQIIQCEITFFNGIWIDRETARKEAEEAEGKMKAYIKKAHEEAFKNYSIIVIPAEFMVVAGEDTT